MLQPWDVHVRSFDNLEASRELSPITFVFWGGGGEGGGMTQGLVKRVTNSLSLELSPRLLDQILNSGFKFDLVLL